MTRSPGAADLPLGPALEFLQRLWQLDHALARLSSRMEKRLGITARQRFVIRCVGTYPGMTAGQLATVLHVDPGTVSAALRRLERRGLVQRRRDPADSRRVSLGLTAQGRALDAPTSGTIEEVVEELLASTRPEWADAAVAVLRRFTALLEEKTTE
jgi:MarR family transcriptional regulator, organic hydroperoxide resistance regulator